MFLSYYPTATQSSNVMNDAASTNAENKTDEWCKVRELCALTQSYGPLQSDA